MSDAFEFEFSLSEYLDRLRTRLPGDFRDSLNELSTLLQLRDDDLTDYLNTTADGETIGVAVTGMSITNATWTAMSWTSEEYVTGTSLSWASSPNPTRVTCNVAGLYIITSVATSSGD